MEQLAAVFKCRYLIDSLILGPGDGGKWGQNGKACTQYLSSGTSAGYCREQRQKPSLILNLMRTKQVCEKGIYKTRSQGTASAKYFSVLEVSAESDRCLWKNNKSEQ